MANRPRRAATKTASKAWESLSPKKRPAKAKENEEDATGEATKTAKTGSRQKAGVTDAKEVNEALVVTSQRPRTARATKKSAAEKAADTPVEAAPKTAAKRSRSVQKPTAAVDDASRDGSKIKRGVKDTPEEPAQVRPRKQRTTKKSVVEDTPDEPSQPTAKRSRSAKKSVVEDTPDGSSKPTAKRSAKKSAVEDTPDEAVEARPGRARSAKKAAERSATAEKIKEVNKTGMGYEDSNPTERVVADETVERETPVTRAGRASRKKKETTAASDLSTEKTVASKKIKGGKAPQAVEKQDKPKGRARRGQKKDAADVEVSGAADGSRNTNDCTKKELEAQKTNDEEQSLRDCTEDKRDKITNTVPVETTSNESLFSKLVKNTSKRPIYQTTPTTEANKTKPGNDMMEDETNDDVYDVLQYGEDEFGPEPDVKKKKKRKPRKKQADIIITFGQACRKNAAVTLKALQNLKTPVPKQQQNPSLPARKPLATLNKDKPSVGAPPANHTAASVQSSIGYTRDCDDFLPSYADDGGDFPDVTNASLAAPARALPPAVKVSIVPNQSPLSPPQAMLHLKPSNVPAQAKNYATPAIPKHVSKVDNKVSTPRLEDKLPAKELSRKELVKCAFGFDDSSEDEQENESLLGISPVRGVAHFPHSSSIMGNSRMSTASVVATTKAAPNPETSDGPYRFTLTTKNVRKPQRAVPKKPAVAKPDGGFKQPAQASLVVEDFSFASPIRPPEPKVIVAPAEDKENVDESNGKHEPSLYEEVGDEKANLGDSAADGDDENEDTATNDGSLLEDGGGENEDDEGEEEGEGPKKDAFTVLRESMNQGTVPKKVKTRSNTKKAPAKVKKSKQTLIYEVKRDGAAGSKKQLKSFKRKAPKNDLNDDTTMDEGSEAPPRKKKDNRTYCRKTLNTSVGAPSPKKKEDKKFTEWQKLQSSHFSEVEDFDLSFL